MKKKKILLGILSIIGILSITIGVSVAFFNYTRTGAENTLNVGRISFTTNQTRTINLTGVFPISSSNVLTDNDNVGTVEVEITGDTDYTEGIEYLITSENAHVTTTSGKLIPISLDVSATNLGTENNNYFTAREDKNASIYKKMTDDSLNGDQMLLVGYIKPNTTLGTAEGVNGKITIRAYLDADKIAISDTYDGSESDNMGTTNNWVNGRTVLTTNEWDNLSSNGVSFRVRVEANEGIWVNEKSNFEISGSKFITMLNSSNTTSKYEVIRNTIDDDGAVPNIFISTSNNNFSISNGVVTINQNNTLNKITLGATVNNRTIYKNIQINPSLETPQELYDTVTTIEGEYAGQNSGSIISSSNWIRSDYVEIDDNKVLFLNSDTAWGTSVLVAFYDSNHEFISGYSESNRGNLNVYNINGELIYGKILSIPDDAEYMIVSLDKARYNNNVMNVFYINKSDISLYEMNLDYSSTNSLQGLKVVHFGDSIFGNYSSPSDIPSYISTYFESTNYNVGFGGTRMSYHDTAGYNAFSMYNLADSVNTGDFTLQDNNVSTSNSFSAKLTTLKSIDFNDIDYITIAFGTNDLASGQLYPNSSTPLDTTTYVGAARYSIEKIQDAYPDLKIILITPIYRFWADGTDASNKIQSTKYMSEYVNALKRVSQEYENVYLFDGYTELGIDNINRYVYFNFRDNTHPNENGIKLYAYKLGKYIENLEN